MPFYRITGLGPCLDGLVVEGQPFDPGAGEHWVQVKALHDPNHIMGDRIVSVPLTVCSMLIADDCVQECGDPREMEFTTQNPFGSCLYEMHYEKGKLLVDCAQFEKALQVTVREGGRTLGEGPTKTLLSTYFRQDRTEEEDVKSLIEECLAEDEDDLVSLLRQLKSVEEQVG